MLEAKPKTDRLERKLESKLPPFSFGSVAAKKVTTTLIVIFFFFLLQ
jgi:hypothetical protein